MIQTDALAAFAVFADHLNFTRAAAALHLSQPALHVKVAKLAATVGRPLYQRSGRTLTLTPEGEAVARFARDLDARMAAFLTEVRDAEAVRPLTLAAGEGAYLYLLGEVVRTFRPLRLVNRDSARMLASVRAGRVDLGIGVLEVLPDDVTTVLLASYPQTLVLPVDHPLAGHAELTLRDLAGVSLVLPPANRPHRRTVERALRAAEVDWALAIEAEGWPLTLHFVTLGVGLSIVNGCVRPPAGFTAREITDLPRVPYYAVHLPSRADDARLAELLSAVRLAI
ncbi:LysR family transcriptional regulator [Actinophytocola oryzae]|uniref:DNA-binding transcriptional LysR family regulator n=1 Tax=Actinophytocola oryzae TaxID=502181 RepID=A0A4R7VCX2_9PSEU|nr:LysR family transcriptional regulator [Actinophytocola oryzae]TDV46828.1 DNA-binding transcriptional LysR family regulator [Actinophytocola oryzae]